MDQKDKKPSAFVHPYNYSHNPEIAKKNQTFRESPLQPKNTKTCDCNTNKNNSSSNNKKKEKLD